MRNCVPSSICRLGADLRCTRAVMLCGVLLLAVTFSNAAASVVLDATDCKVLFSWAPYAALAASHHPQTSCSPPEPCTQYPGQLRCSDAGRVTALNLEGHRLAGTLPVQWSTISSLSQLRLGGNNLTGTLPKEWSIMVALSHLYLEGNQLSGGVPKEWSSFPHLAELDLGGNELTGTLPTEWAALSSLFELSLGGNNLRGTLPTEWAAMTNLFFLKLSGNQLSGSLPAAWRALTELNYLYLDQNLLSGSLPPEWSAMAALADLNVEGNRLSGVLPPGWSAMPELKDLWLGSNELTGTLPADWGALQTAYNMMLDGNQLSGTVPQEWATMGFLTHLNLTGNRGIHAGRSWPQFRYLRTLELKGTSVTPSFLSTWKPYPCAPAAFSIMLPGRAPVAVTADAPPSASCAFLQRHAGQVVGLLGAAVALLGTLLLLRCCCRWRAVRAARYTRVPGVGGYCNA